MDTPSLHRDRETPRSRAETAQRAAKAEADRKHRQQLRQLGINIASYRKRKGYSQVDFAYMLGFSNSAHLSRIESGGKAPSMDVLFRMADLLQIRVQDLFCDM